MCNDTRLQDLPFKIELNAYGVMEMSPASTRHGRYRAPGRQVRLSITPAIRKDAARPSPAS